MNYTLFINKYQPKYLKDFHMKDSLFTTLHTFINLNHLNLILIGPHGSGKTSMIQSIVKEYYIQYSEKDYTSNILHITSLNNLGIEYFRNDVKVFCQTKSIIPDKKKIVILDDIDCINEQNQQVIRNLMDKYSNNVHFFASCSNIYKIIDNLQSRFTLINIPHISHQVTAHLLNHIIENEKIIMNEDAIEFLLNICNRNIKVMISYLEKYKLLNMPIDIKTCKQLCTTISFDIMEEYTLAIKQNDLKKAVQLIYDIYHMGYSVVDILDNYFQYIKITQTLSDKEKYDIIPYLCKYIKIFNETHEDCIELSLFTNNLINRLHV